MAGLPSWSADISLSLQKRLTGSKVKIQTWETFSTSDLPKNSNSSEIFLIHYANKNKIFIPCIIYIINHIYFLGLPNIYRSKTTRRTNRSSGLDFKRSLGWSRTEAQRKSKVSSELRRCGRSLPELGGQFSESGRSRTAGLLSTDLVRADRTNGPRTWWSTKPFIHSLCNIGMTWIAWCRTY